MTENFVHKPDSIAEREPRPIRILYRIGKFPGSISYKEAGGAERTLQKLTNGLSAINSGYEMTVCVGEDLDPNRPVSEKPVNLVSQTGKSDLNQYINNNRTNFDILHFADGLYLPNIELIGAVASWDKSKPIIARLTGAFYLDGLKNAPPKIKNYLFSRLSKIIAISPEISLGLENIGVKKEKIVSIPNAVDTNKFQPVNPERKSDLRTSLYDGLIPNNKRIFIFHGRIMEHKKRIRTLINQWVASNLGLEGHALVLIGPISEKDEEYQITRMLIENNIDQNLIWTGPKSNEEISQYLQSADIFVLPSSTEGMSNSLLEGLSSGLPAIVRSNVSGTDMVRDGFSGAKFSTDSDLSMVLRKFANESSGLETMSENARLLILEKYSVEAMIRSYDELYRNLLNKK